MQVGPWGAWIGSSSGVPMTVVAAALGTSEHGCLALGDGALGCPAVVAAGFFVCARRRSFEAWARFCPWMSDVGVRGSACDLRAACPSLVGGIRVGVGL